MTELDHGEPPADQEPEVEVTAAAGGSAREPDAVGGVLDNRWARGVGVALFAVLAVAAVLSGWIGVELFVFVALPVLAAIVLSEMGLDRQCAWARIATVIGLVLWLALTGGLPMLLVVGAVVLMIFLHELGHYLAARRAGMLVTEFFLGFGTRLFSFRRGDTEFGLKAIPAGAYVKIVGMNNLEEVDPADEPRTYRQARFTDRLSVAVAGSAMHFALALVLLVVQLSVFGRADDEQWVVGDLTEAGAAEQAGLQEGDRILSFAGEPVGSFSDFRAQIHDASGTVQVVVERDGSEQDLQVDLIRRAKVIGTVGTDVDVLEGPGGLSVGPLVPNSRGERAGLVTGQRIVGVNGTEISTIDDLGAAIDDSNGGEVVFSVPDASGAGSSDVSVDLGSAVGTTAATAFLGVGADPVLQREPLPSAVGTSVTEFGRVAGASVVGIGAVFNPPELLGFFSSTVTGTDKDVTDQPTPAEEVAVSTDAGRPTSIIGAIAYGADLTGENLSNLIGFLIGLNIFIGVFNLIPLLPFDGGHVAIAVYEKAREMRRRTKNRYIADVTRMLPVAYTVVMVLVVVGLMAMYLDLTRGVSA